MFRQLAQTLFNVGGYPNTNLVSSFIEIFRSLSIAARLQKSSYLAHLDYDRLGGMPLDNRHMSSRDSHRIIIIGAGIIGAAAAYFLSRHNVAVTVLEGEAPSAGASGASDGAVSVGTKRPGPMMKIARQARALYEELHADGVLAGIYHRRRTFLIARSDEERDLVARHIADLNLAGEPAQELRRRELDHLLSGLGTSVLGGGVVPGDGHVLGYEVVSRLLRLSGAEVLRNRAALGLETLNGRVTGVRTAAGSLPADTVIVAAGLGSRELLGLTEALFPRKGQILITDRLRASGPALAGHIISAAYLAAKRAIQIDKPQIGLVIDPLVTGQLLIGGTRESDNDDRQTDAETISAIVRQAIDLYPAVARCRVIRTFAGIRTASRDGLPIVGLSSACEGLIIATGFEGDGICLGPLMGRLSAEFALGVEPSIDASSLSPQRFAVQGAEA
jgi:glycine/D-amino acid oxidase-like deaminating enzyme